MKSPIVVVVDRNPAHRSLINYNLAQNKFPDVHTFQSGDECIYRMKKNFIPDFIISDLDPGGLRGLDFLSRARAISATVRVIFFAAFDDPEMAIRLHDAGATDYIPKSNTPDIGISELIKNIRYLTREKSIS